MSITRATIISSIATLLVILSLTCEDQGVNVVLTDEEQIARLIDQSSTGKQMFPPIMFDITDLSEIYPDSNSSGGQLSPLDYWVEIISHTRKFGYYDSCAPNEFNQDDPCAAVLLEHAGIVPAKIMHIYDSVRCLYHIVSAPDSEVTTKEVLLADRSFALAAKLGASSHAYGGWKIYGVGKQRQGSGSGGGFPYIDSVVLIVSSSRYPYYPEKRPVYVYTSQMPELAAGQKFAVEIYTREKYGEDIIDAFLHYEVAGVFSKKRISPAGSTSLSFRISGLKESSGDAAGQFSQIVVELMPYVTLRDGDSQQVRTMIFAITYRK